MEVLRAICLFFVLDLSICHVLRVDQKPQSVDLDDVKKERIHFPQGFDGKVRHNRQAGRDAEYVLDSSNGYGLGPPSQNQDILNGNFPTNPTVDIPVAVSPNIGINPGFGANENPTSTQSRQTNNNGNAFPAGNVWNNANPNNRRATTQVGSNARNPQANNNRLVNNNPGVLTTNVNSAVNLGFGMPPVGDAPEANTGNAPVANVGNGPEANVGSGYADQGAWTFPDHEEYDPHHGHYDNHHHHYDPHHYDPHHYWNHHYYG